MAADDALGVAESNLPDTDRVEHAGNGDAGGAGPVHDDLQIRELPAGDSARVDGRRQHHYGGSMLVVVEDGDIALLDQAPLYLEAGGGGNVLQVDAAETGLQQPDRAHDVVGLLAIHTKGESVDRAESFEKHRFTLHHGEGGPGANVA